MNELEVATESFNGSTDVAKAQDHPFLILIGEQINKDLQERKRNVEWLSRQSNLARSTLREIIAGRSNLRILTLQSITEQLGYKSLVEFFQIIKK